jgi:hypothetical protein
MSRPMSPWVKEAPVCHLEAELASPTGDDFVLYRVHLTGGGSDLPWAAHTLKHALCTAACQAHCQLELPRAFEDI